jgi:hypothetical protein
MRRTLFTYLTGIFATATLALAVPSQGPIQPLYVTAGDQGVWFIVQNNSITQIHDAGVEEYAIAVGTTVRTFAVGPGLSGAEYTLAGVPTGNTYPNSFGSQMIDGTTDGTHNYAIQWNTGHVIAFSTTWGNPTFLFGGLPTDTIGITYDATTNTFWTACRSCNMIQNYSITGTLLGGFSVTGGPTGLALNPADGTLWALMQGLSNQLNQYSKAGVLLNSISFPQVSGVNALGLEFQESIPFASFNVKPFTSNPYAFSLNASFSLGAVNQGFNPLTQAVTLQVGADSIVIPAGSFHGTGVLTFSGTINGSSLYVTITGVGGNAYVLSARGGPLNPLPTVNPVNISLTIGAYSGTASVFWYY